MIRPTATACAAALAGSGTIAVLLATGALDPGRPVWLWVLAAGLALAILLTLAEARRRTSWLAVAVSPLSLAALTWVSLFVLRPIELHLNPHHATTGLAQFGFQLSDLTQTAALGAIGCVCCAGAYLLGLGFPERFGGEEPKLSIAFRRGMMLLVVGTALWLVLFLRAGGFHAFLSSPVSIRAHERSSFYAFIGVWLVQGTALVAFLAFLARRTRAAGALLAAGIGLSALAAVGLQVRSLFAYAVLAGVGLYFSLRRLRGRRLVSVVAAGVVGILLLAFAQQVRGNTHFVSTREAIRRTAKTPFLSLFDNDLSTFDNFVAINKLVPGTVHYLDGRTLVEIPLSLIPRGLWHGKPLGVDTEATAYLYPGAPAGSPLSMQGELYWNGGILPIVLGSAVVGFLLGLFARFYIRSTPGSRPALVYFALWPFTYALLTRSLAVMTENIVFALVGVVVVLLVVAPPPDLRADVSAMLRLRRPRASSPTDIERQES
jgi:hypothetical protein